MIEPLSQCSIKAVVARPYDDPHFAVGYRGRSVIRRLFDAFELKNLSVKLGHFFRVPGAKRNGIEAARLVSSVFEVTFPDIGHPFLGQIKLCSRGVLRSNPCERHVAERLSEHEFRIIPFDPVNRLVDVLQFKTKVVEALLASRPFRQESQSNDAVAQVAAIWVVRAGLVYPAGSDLLHAEIGFVKLGYLVIVFGVGGDMSDSGKHKWRSFRV